MQAQLPQLRIRYKPREIYVGEQYLADLYDCQRDDILSNAEQLTSIMKEAAKMANVKPLKSVAHEFSPYGVSVIVIINESHLAIHTWPEYRCALVDVFTCGSEALPQRALEFIAGVLECERLSIFRIRRGIVSKYKAEELCQK